MAHRVTLIPGDGIGPEVSEAVLRIVAAAGVEIEWESFIVGGRAQDSLGSSLPNDVIESIRRNGVALKGPVATAIGTGFESVTVRLRKALDLAFIRAFCIYCLISAIGTAVLLLSAIAYYRAPGGDHGLITNRGEL